MSDPSEPLHALAQAAGLQREWRDVDGRDHVVPDATLARICALLGHPAHDGGTIAASLAKIADEQAAIAPLVVAEAGAPIALPRPVREAEATFANGMRMLLPVVAGVALAPAEPGYYDCTFDGTASRLAVAPPYCPLPPAEAPRPTAVAVQIPALRGAQAAPFGTFGTLAEAAGALGAAGIDAVAINPVHALFAADGTRFSPYSPSSRRFLNPAMADPALCGLPPLAENGEWAEAGGDLIDWGEAIPARLAQLRALFDRLTPDERGAVAGEVDDAAWLHAVFDALGQHFRAQGLGSGWRSWPEAYRQPGSAAVLEFAASHAEDIAFHLFAQGLAREGLAEAQRRALAAGMRVGLVGDLAVGVDPGGSDCWALGDAMLRGLTIGAPPDPLGPHGQNWALTSFSPAGLRRSGYAPWLAMIRAALRMGGGLRIDHAFGLARLWVIPEGGVPGDGCYLTYPFADLAGLLTLEAHLAGAFVVAEDLGTAPPGFTQAIAARRMLGMQVLWFERAGDDGFIGAQDYAPLAAALTGTHDTPTLAGWWSGTDLDWAERLGRLPAGQSREEAESRRDWDRGLLFATLAGDAPRPAPQETGRAVDAAIAHLARTPSALAIVPLEDLLGLVEQPNIPGTIAEHPNWRRRLAAPLARLLESEPVAARLAVLTGGACQAGLGPRPCPSSSSPSSPAQW